MEVFLSNLPPDPSHRALARQLEPFMTNLSIQDWTCDKPRKKTFGNITFLHEADGKKFLDRHGEIHYSNGPRPQPRTESFHSGISQPQRGTQNQSQQRNRSRLTLMGRPIFCKLSKYKPQPLTLRGLEHAAEKRETKVEVAEDTPIKFDDVISFGCGHYTFYNGELTFVSEWESLVQGSAKFTKKSLILRLSGSSDFQIRIPTQTIYELVASNKGDIVLTLTTAPIFLISQTLEHLFGSFGVTLLELIGNRSQVPPLERVPGIDKAHESVASYCLMYHLRFGGGDNVQFHNNVRKLQARNLITVVRQDVPICFAHDLRLPPYATAVTELKDLLSRYTTKSVLPFEVLFLLQALVYNGYLHPNIVHRLAQRLAEERAAAIETGETSTSSEAIKKLFTWIDYRGTETKPEELEVDYIMDLLKEAEKEVDGSAEIRSSLLRGADNLTFVYRAVAMPSRITLHGPELESKNRVLRKFPEHQDYFLRVQFCDENGRDLFYSPKISLDTIYNRFKSIFERGIQIAGRIYAFLGFSHSSLRAHSAWFVAPFVYQGTVFSSLNIIGDLGDFTGITSAARKAARIGQAFSETPFTVPLKEHDISVVQIADVNRSSRVFSDGVGTVSRGALKEIWRYLPTSKRDPTCLQIRFAGAKGMISLYVSDAVTQSRDAYSVIQSLEESDETHKVIAIRPSMKKFESKDIHQLEICDAASKPIKLILNRQLVKIMEDMGVPDDWFMDLQDRELNRIRGVTRSTSNTAYFLKAQNVGEAMELWRFFRHIDGLGLEYRKDDFLRAIVETAVLKELRLLKYKARIPVNEGVTLFGVMDEYGFLEEGEVYFTYDSMAGRYAPSPGDCEVIVTRSPALHPGDVQMAHHVVPPDGHELRNLSNCIVFSQHGTRDLPSQLSGGDLDGDIYNIIWDKSAVNRVKRTFSPADYPRVKPLELNREVTPTDMATFFVDFMKTDHLGVIATRHMILADQMDEGTLHSDCIKLAELHSTAVDFSKSGRAVELNELPRSHKLRPDFFAPGPNTVIHDKSKIDLDLENQVAEDGNYDSDEEDGPRYKYYRSEKLLGRLFRGIDENSIWYEDVKATVPTGGSSFWDDLIFALRPRWEAFGSLNWAELEGEARNIRHSYEDAMTNAMSDFSENPTYPLSELEVCVGHIINKSGNVQTGRQRDKSVKLKEEFDRISLGISRMIRNHSANTESDYLDIKSVANDGTVITGTVPTPGIASAGPSLDGLAMAVACLHVACESNNRSRLASRRRTTEDGLVSFKMVAATTLSCELQRLEANGKVAKANSGGYPGVRGHGAAASAASIAATHGHTQDITQRTANRGNVLASMSQPYTIPTTQSVTQQPIPLTKRPEVNQPFAQQSSLEVDHRATVIQELVARLSGTGSC